MARWSAGGCRPADTVDPRVELSLSLWNGSGPMLVLGKPKTPRQEGKRPRVEHSVYCIAMHWGKICGMILGGHKEEDANKTAGGGHGARCAREKCECCLGQESLFLNCVWLRTVSTAMQTPPRHHRDLQTPPSMYSSNIAFIVICIMWEWWPRIQY